MMRPDRGWVGIHRVVLFAGVLAALSGCTRSTQFQRNEAFYQPETRTQSQRLESMGQPRKRVVVLDFWNDTPVKDDEIGKFAADELRRGLFATQRMILPTDVKSEFTTHDFLQGDQVKVAQLIREGRRLGVSVLVIGRISKIVFRQRGEEVGILRQKQSLAAVDAELKIFDVTGGREILAVGRSGDAASNSLVAFEDKNQTSQDFRGELSKLAVRHATEGLVPDVVRAVEKMTWQGHIAKIIGTKVYVNAGKQSGLVEGDILRVLTNGEDIYDPKTGSYLGRTSGQLKGTLEVVDFIGTDGAVAELHTGGGFGEGDLVRLY